MIAAFPSPRNEHGSVLLIVLWTAALLTILVTAMASQVRLSARTAFNNQLAADDLAQSMTALHAAEMELMLELLPPPIDLQAETDSEGALLNRRHRFDGRPLRLSYPSPDDWVVRIVNHAGKINLNRIPRANMQLLIERGFATYAAKTQTPTRCKTCLRHGPTGQISTILKALTAPKAPTTKS
jgi:general secretion pathway protein K